MPEEPQDQLQRLARELAAMSAPLASALAKIQGPSTAISEAARTVTQAAQLNENSLAQVSQLLAIQGQTLLRSSYAPVLEANRTLAQLLSTTNMQADMSAEALAALAKFDAIPAQLKLDPSVTAALMQLEGSRTFAASLVAQDTLAELNKLSVGSLIGADATFRRSTAAHIGQISRSYSALINASAGSEGNSDLVASAISTAPVEYYRHVQALRSITIDTGQEFPSETVEAAVDSAGPTVESLLTQVDDNLIVLLDGARQAVASSNPDRPRHVTTSLRELITQTLHAVAPDDAILHWSSEPKLYHNGRPTRRARILYICRCIDDGPMCDFVKADVSAALAFIDSLNAGTHTVQSKLTDAQLRAQVARTESLLIFILQLTL